MKAESYFLRYAYPCAFIIRERNEIDDKTMEMLEKAAIEKKILGRKFLEKVFHNAFKRIEILAKEMGKDKWDFEVIKKYFRERHNEEIDNKIDYYANAPESLRELSKVSEARIVDKRPGFFVVQYENKTRTVSDVFVPDAEKGDNITIHYGFAVEKLS